MYLLNKNNIYYRLQLRVKINILIFLATFSDGNRTYYKHQQQSSYLTKVMNALCILDNNYGSATNTNTIIKRHLVQFMFKRKNKSLLAVCSAPAYVKYLPWKHAAQKQLLIGLPSVFTVTTKPVPQHSATNLSLRHINHQVQP